MTEEEKKARARERVRLWREKQCAEDPEAFMERQREKNRRYRERNLEKVRERGRTRQTKKRAEDPEGVREAERRYRALNRDRLRAAERQRRAENPEKARAKDRRHRQKNLDARREAYRRWLAENPEKARGSYMRYKEQNRDRVRDNMRRWREKNPEAARRWKAENRDKVAADAARRHAAKLNAIPPWITAEQIQDIEDWYALAASTGMTVDHIVPLRGKTASGLHVPWNLRLLPNRENAAKGNRLLDDAHEII